MNNQPPRRVRPPVAPKPSKNASEQAPISQEEQDRALAAAMTQAEEKMRAAAQEKQKAHDAAVAERLQAEEEKKAAAREAQLKQDEEYARRLQRENQEPQGQVPQRNKP